MTRKSKSLAQALKGEGTRAPASQREATPEAPARAPSRRGRKAVTFYTNGEAHKQLRLLAIEQERSLQDLMVEATNALFVTYGKAQIAD